MKKIILISFLFMTGTVVMGGDDTNRHRWISIGWDNDVIFQTDKYYTNGLKIEYFSRNRPHSVLKYFHFQAERDENFFSGYSLSQDIFTPADKYSLEKQIGDRPFASSLLLSSQSIVANNVTRVIKKSELQIGILGRLSGGEFVQNGIHGLLPTSGWENQIRTQPVLNYSMQYEKLLAGNNYVHISGLLEGKLGLAHLFGGAGIQMRIGSVNEYFKHLNFYSSQHISSFYYTAIKGKLVGYNATIQGGLFSDAGSEYPDINHLIYELDTGVNFSYRSVQVKLGLKVLSPEFKSGQLHRWGYLSFIVGI